MSNFIPDPGTLEWLADFIVRQDRVGQETLPHDDPADGVWWEENIMSTGLGMFYGDDAEGAAEWLRGWANHFRNPGLFLEVGE